MGEKAKKKRKPQYVKKIKTWNGQVFSVVLIIFG